MEMMGSNANSVQLKVFVDKEKTKVMFAEADADFVEILFGFLTLPLGTIARLSSYAKSNNIKFASLTSLYESAVNLDVKHFSNKHCKAVLVNPSNSSGSLCQKLRVNLNASKPIDASVSGGHGDAVFVKMETSFIITDDLNVVPFELETSIAFLNSLGVQYIHLLDEMTMFFGLEEFLNLLKWSLLTNNPLTNLVLGGSNPCSNITISTLSNSPLPSSNAASFETMKLVGHKSKKVLLAQVESFFVEPLFSFLTIPLSVVQHLTGSFSPVGISNLYKSITNSTLSNSPLPSSNSAPSETVMLLVHKSKKKILLAQVESFFVDLLFSFLTIPLGVVQHLTMSSSSPVGLSNLYKSILSLEDGKYLSEDVKNMLLHPKLATNCPRVTELLPIYETKVSGSFVKEQATFIVSDDLEVAPALTTSTISKFNTLGIPVDDMEVLEVKIGEHEALQILKACLTSTSTLTDCLYEFSKKQKAEPST